MERKSQALNFLIKGNELEDQEKYVEALECYNQALAFDEMDDVASLTWLSKGNCERKLNQDEKAIESYNKSILLNPQEHLAFFFKGRSLKELNRSEEALEAFNKCIQLDCKDTKA